MPIRLPVAVTRYPVHLTKMLLHRYPELPEFSDYLPLIREATECFFLHRQRAAVAALVPVVEGLLLKFLGKLQGRDDLNVTGAELLQQVIKRECDRAARRLVFQGMRVPDEYYERRFLEQASEYVFLLSTFEAFGVRNLFAPTWSFATTHNLNRHGILHGKWTNFGRPENFHRLWSILDMIAFAVTMGTSGVSGFAPPLSPEALLLAHRLDMMGQMMGLMDDAGRRDEP